jgi:hypothetical protein
VLHYCIVSLTSSFLSIYPYRRSCRRSCSPRHRAIYPGSHCFFVRPGTRASSVIAFQFLPLCFTIASFSVLFSSFVHLPTRVIVSSLFQDTVPSCITLLFRSTQNQRNCASLLHQRTLFFFCPFTLEYGPVVALGDQDIVPSTPTLLFRSTRHQCGSCLPILATVIFCCMHPPECRLLLLSMDPCVQSSRRSWSASYRAILHNTVFSFDPEPAR